MDFGPPLHCLALCGDSHPLELEVGDHNLTSVTKCVFSSLFIL